MKTLIALLFLLTIQHNLYSQKKEYPPEIKPIPKTNPNIFYSDDARYRYTLDTENISLLNPNTEFLKTIHFKNSKNAVIETVSNTDEAQLIDNSLLKSNFKQKVSETEYTVSIKWNQVILTNTKNKKKIMLNIINENSLVLMLANPKTGEKYISLNPEVESIKKYNQPPFYIPSNNSSKNPSK